MHLDHTDAFDVVERVGLVATEALVHPRPFFAADHLVHHLEVHHVMARRRLVALRAFGRFWAGMQEAVDFPSFRCVAICALGTEKSLMDIPRRVAGLAVEFCSLSRSTPRNLLEDLVIHPNRTKSAALMLDVATRALLQVGVEGGRWFHQEFRSRSVACDTGCGLDALIGSMAALAFAFKKRVCA